MGIFDTENAEYAVAYAEEAAMVDASELIANALEHAAMTRSELARVLNVSKSEVTARLAGERNITVRSLAKTLHVLGEKLELRSVLTVQKPASTRGRLVHIEQYRALRVQRAHQSTSAQTLKFTEKRLISAMGVAK
jgi:transcriptional regulator with XRE-family HTH domain